MATPTMEEVFKNVDLEKLNEPCKDEHLNELALSIKDWPSIAPFLGLTEAEESAIKNDHNKTRKQTIEMLRKWRNKFGRKATYRKLAEALLKLEEAGLVERLCDLIQQPQSITSDIQSQDSCKVQGISGVQISTLIDPEEANRRIYYHYANTLRDKYRTGIHTSLTLQWPPPPTHKVFNLAMISERELNYGSNDELVRLLLRGDVSGVMNRKNQVTLKKISDSLHSKGRKIILIEGAPGAGKSTLAWHLCTEWEAKKLFQEFEIVLFVQLREPAIQSANSLQDLFPAESLNKKKEVVSAIQYCGGHQVLIVLDSWDEFSPGLSQDSIIKTLICNPFDLNMQFCALIITSRPIATAELQRYISSRVQIAGFLQSEVKCYFTEAIPDPPMVQKLIDHLRERPMIEASCYLPLNTAIVTHLFLAQNYTLPATLHQVFTSVVICCIQRHLKKQPKEDGISSTEEDPDTPVGCWRRRHQRRQAEKDISSLDNLPPSIQDQFNNLCTLAYHGVMDNKATFSAADLDKFKLPTELSTLSLIQGVASFTHQGDSKLYNFFHLSTQELLAAFYISKMKPAKQVAIFNELFKQPRFSNVFQFYAGFTKLQARGIRDTVSRITNSKDMNLILSVLRCLYEAQDDKLCQFVAQQLQNKLVLTGQTLSPVDCLSVGHFAGNVCTTTVFKLTFAIGRLDEYLATLIEKELSQYCTLQPETATKGKTNLNLELVKGSNFIAEHGKIISKLGLYLKALK